MPVRQNQTKTTASNEKGHGHTWGLRLNHLVAAWVTHQVGDESLEGQRCKELSPDQLRPAPQSFYPGAHVAKLWQGNERLRLTRLRLQQSLKPRHVMPGAVLKTHVPVHANWLEPHGLVQPDASRVRERHASVGVDVALQWQHCQQ